MFRLNQKGALDVYLVLALVIVLGAGGFVLWRIQKANEPVPVSSTVSQSKAAEKEDVDYSKFNSVECTELNIAQTAEQDAAWKTKLASTSVVREFNETNGDQEYTTYFGNVCKLTEDHEIVTFTHYYDKENADGTVEIVSIKGVAHFDADGKEVYTAKDLPCEAGPPDASAPATIEEVVDGEAHLTCPGSEPVDVHYSLSTYEWS